jgi:hypothetical protein
MIEFIRVLLTVGSFYQTIRRTLQETTMLVCWLYNHIHETGSASKNVYCRLKDIIKSCKTAVTLKNMSILYLLFFYRNNITKFVTQIPEAGTTILQMLVLAYLLRAFRLHVVLQLRKLNDTAVARNLFSAFGFVRWLTHYTWKKSRHRFSSTYLPSFYFPHSIYYEDCHCPQNPSASIFLCLSLSHTHTHTHTHTPTHTQSLCRAVWEVWHQVAERNSHYTCRFFRWLKRRVRAGLHKMW